MLDDIEVENLTNCKERLRGKAQVLRQLSRNSQNSRERNAALRGKAAGLMQAADWIESYLGGNIPWDRARNQVDLDAI